MKEKEKKENRGSHGKQGRRSNESKGLQVKVMYPKRVNADDIPYLDSCLDENYKQFMKDFLNKLQHSS